MGGKAVKKGVIRGDILGLAKGRMRRWNSSSNYPGNGENMFTQTRAPGKCGCAEDVVVRSTEWVWSGKGALG